jgi:very-short-patch-repair endonuclease
VEIDGRDVHSRPDAVLHDRARQNLLTGRGTTLLRFTGREAWDGTAAARIAAVLAAAGRHRPLPPPGYRFRLAA